MTAADFPGGRSILSAACNALTSLRGNDVRIQHDGEFWLYKNDGMTLPRGRKFDFYDYDLRHLGSRIRHYLKETDDCWFYAYKPTPGDVIVDVGAEVGTDTVTFSRAVGTQGHVIAIEAHPKTFELLQRTCRANKLRNVSAIWMAVADKKGSVRITSDAGVEGNFISEEGEPVPADCLDSILAHVPRIDFLKMNIEGAEQLAIRGMNQTLAKTSRLAIACHDFVADETGNDWFRTIGQVSDYLQRNGFQVSRRDSDDRSYVKCHLHARRAD